TSAFLEKIIHPSLVFSISFHPLATPNFSFILQLPDMLIKRVLFFLLAVFVAFSSPLNSKEDLLETNRVPTEPFCKRLNHTVPSETLLSKLDYEDGEGIVAPDTYDKGMCSPGCKPEWTGFTALVHNHRGRRSNRTFPYAVIVDCKIVNW
ncbi:hypothetical protein PMAYCL1PPCAC_32271, partial [Pristionchus mayeri]